MATRGETAFFPVGYVILASGLERTPKEVWGGAQVFMNVAQSPLPVILPVTAGWAVDRYGYDSFFLYLSAAIYFVAAAAILMVPEATKYHDGSNHDPAPVTGRQGAT